jgi:hypothetical protein
MAPPSITSFPAEVVPQAPEDPLFGLMRAFKADTSPDKVDLVRDISPRLLLCFRLRSTDKSVAGNRRVP